MNCKTCGIETLKVYDNDLQNQKGEWERMNETFYEKFLGWKALRSNPNDLQNLRN